MDVLVAALAVFVAACLGTTAGVYLGASLLLPLLKQTLAEAAEIDVEAAVRDMLTSVRTQPK